MIEKGLPETHSFAPKVESHQRQLVDASDPTYKNEFGLCFCNSTNGSWWILQVQPSGAKTSEL